MRLNSLVEGRRQQSAGLRRGPTIMDKTRITPGMWRIDPLKMSRVVDRFGKKVASAETGSDASMMAAAPDLYDVLEKLDNYEGEISERCARKSRWPCDGRGEISGSPSSPHCPDSAVFATKSG
jgi:hypothetical protein